MRTCIRELLRCAPLVAMLAAGPVARGADPVVMQMLQTTAEQYTKTMAGYDDTEAAQKKAARDGYLLALDMARKREVSAKRPAAAAAIDAEVAAVKAGPLAEKPPAQFPSDLGTYRSRFISEMKRADTALDSVRKQATGQHLKWLDGLEAAAKGKDEDVVKAIAAERARVQGPAAKPAPR